MAALDIEGLVSQAEDEGITLAEMISRTLSPEQMDKLQNGLCNELTSNYAKIEGFMRDVKVPSLDELMSQDEILDSCAVMNDDVRCIRLSDSGP
jgi:hypothetical protein